jgi:hypothetical protein
MSEFSDRDTLIRVEAQLQDSIRNQSQIISDLRTIFNRIELESKTVAAIGAEIRTHKETSALRWSEAEKKIDALERANQDIANAVNQLNSTAIKDKEELKDAIEEECKERVKTLNEETKERQLYQENINASVSTTKIIVVIFVGIISLIATIIGIYQFFKGH